MILKEPENSFEPAPAGLHNAVCVDVVDLGEVETPWGAQERMRVVWQLAARMGDGRRYLVSRRYKPSLHPKASLRKDLEAWNGGELAEEELKGFDTERLVGRGCQLNVTRRTANDGRIWANVSAIVPLAEGTEPIEPDGYTRVKEREEVPF